MDFHVVKALLKQVEGRFPDSLVRQLSSTGKAEDFQTLYKLSKRLSYDCLVIQQVFSIHKAYIQAVLDYIKPNSSVEYGLELGDLR